MPPVGIASVDLRRSCEFPASVVGHYCLDRRRPVPVEVGDGIEGADADVGEAAHDRAACCGPCIGRARDSVVMPQSDSWCSMRARSRFSKSESEPLWWLPPPLSREDAAGDSVGRAIAVGEQPGRPARKVCSGNLVLRISPEVHAAVPAAAGMRGESIDE